MKDLFPFYSIGSFINQPSNPTEFEILIIQEMEEPDVEDPHKHLFYAIIWIDEGEGWQAIDYNEYKITPGSLFFISPGQLHFFETYKEFKGGSILFTEDFFLLNHQDKDKLFELSFLDNFYAKPNLKLKNESFKEIRETINLLIKEKGRKETSSHIIQSLLNIMLLQIQRYIDVNSKELISKKYIVLFKKLKKLIDTHYLENLSVSDYASKLHITQHHLNVITKQVTGKTAGEAIRARSLLEAKRLLTFSDLTVTEISSHLSFFDSSYFSRLFKKETGMALLTFKIKMSEKYRKR